MSTHAFQKNDLFGVDLSQSGPFILRQLDVFNWGPFNGRHCAEIDEKGTAIIGPTGSGKTTLVDALMTLITTQPKYNLASTGGHESDRDLMSYIRGVSGAGNNTGDNRHIARKRKTVTGISANFSNGHQTLKIAAIFWIDGPSFSTTDRKDLWIYSESDEQSLDHWLATLHEGGARALKQLGRETTKLQIFDTKKAYLAQVRRFFEVGENAFLLLNRAAGLKQLNSIDEIFRELVLDDRSAFECAESVAKEFDNLAAIRSELETARRQQQSLLPVQEANQAQQKLQQKLLEQNQLHEIAPIWFALAGEKLWQAHAEKIKNDLALLTHKIKNFEQQAQGFKSKADTLKEIYLKLGGNTVEQLKEQIKTQHQLVVEKKHNAEDYQRLATTLKLDAMLTAPSLQENKQWAEGRISALNPEIQQQQQQVYDLGSANSEQQKISRTLQEEVSKIVARPGSNLPSQYQDFRADLSVALGLSEDDVLFVAELLEVKPEEQAWRGAIERAIGGHRLRLLIPSAHMQAALRWVNHRDNRLHVRLLEAKAVTESVIFFKEGFTKKLVFKSHVLREALKAFLATIDRQCVDSEEVLKETPHAMTVQGLMSGARGRFEKQDQQPLNKGWMTGFDNKDRLNSLRKELQVVEAELQKSQSNLQKSIQNLEKSRQQVMLLTQLTVLEFERINLPAAQAILTTLESRLSTLTDPNSEVGKARKDYEIIANEIDKIDSQIKQENKALGNLERQLATACDNQKKACKRIGQGLVSKQQQLAEQKLPAQEKMHLENLDEDERTTLNQIEQKRDKLNARLGDVEKTLVRLMGKAKAEDTGALAEVGTELQDIAAYLERLRVLGQEALPEKLNRFLAYLNQSSDQGVTQLLADIENEVSIIEERINDLNDTLRRVDFQSDCYLQLVPQRVVHESLRTLQSAQKHLRVAVLKDDQGESHYHALAQVVTLLRDAAENKRTVGARALLDPRYRLQFSVSVVQRQSNTIIETRTGSQGGSGGEKEIIASYILTASLSYALCPQGSVCPLFGSIVLDEAFSKSSQAVAGRIISALREFGLHPLFVTPNKEMQLLRNHTRSAILVHRKGLQATLTSLRWEELEAHAQSKIRQPNEVA